MLAKSKTWEIALGSESQQDWSPNTPKPIWDSSFFHLPFPFLLMGFITAHLTTQEPSHALKQNSRLCSYSLEFCKFFFLLLIFKEKKKHTSFCPGYSLDVPAEQATFFFLLENIHLLSEKEEHSLVMAVGWEASGKLGLNRALSWSLDSNLTYWGLFRGHLPPAC